MRQFRVSPLADADLRSILAASTDRWGVDRSVRYAKLLAAAMRAIAADPDGPLSRDRGDLVRGIRSFHVRHARRATGVRDPVHLLYYRVLDAETVEIVRVLHERMDPPPRISARRRGARSR